MRRVLLVLGFVMSFVVGAGLSAAAAPELTVISDWEATHGVVETETYLDLGVGSYQVELGGYVVGFLEESERRQDGIDRLSVRYEGDNWGLMVGKNRPAWGFSGFQSVMLSGEAPGFPLVQFDWNWNRLSYSKFVGSLGSNDTIFGHRYAVRIFDGVEIGVKEVARWVERFHGMGLAYAPFYPLYLTKYIPGTDGVNDNMEAGVDLRVNRFEHVKLYADFHASEWPQFENSRQLPLYALQVGVTSDSLPFGLGGRAEYLRIMNYIYTHKNGLDYEYEGVPLGHPLGPDGEAVRFELEKELSSALALLVGYEWQRKGEGEIGDGWTTIPRDVAEANLFLGGTVETCHTPHVGARWQPTSDLTVEGRIARSSVQNYEHIRGGKANRYSAELSIRWEAF